jgi:hypothetical protein
MWMWSSWARAWAARRRGRAGAVGRRIVILERGERLADTPEARDADAIFARGHFRPRRPG